MYKDGAWSYINKKGKTVRKPQYDSADSFSDGLALVSKDGKNAYIDKKGKIVLQ